MEHVVVVGAGAAGARSVERLRQSGFDGRITLVGDEAHLPYDRPPLSKAALTAGNFDSELGVDYVALDVEVRLGEAACGLRAGVLQTTRGMIEYDGAVLATGSGARQLSPVAGHPDLHYLRTRDDAARLRGSLRSGRRTVIVGAGWIGAEVASTAAVLGAEVVVVEMSSAPASTLPPEIGASFAHWYDAAGVRLVTEDAVIAADGSELVLASGERLHADVLVVGIGGTPAIDWLGGSAVDHDQRGILVDRFLRTNLPGVVAAGDVVSYPSERAGRRITITHRDDAYASADAAVRALLDPALDTPFDPVPYFWSEQFGRHVQMVGWPDASDQILWRGRPRSDSWAACWLRTGRLRAMVAVGRPRDIARGRRLIADGAVVDPDLVIDPLHPIQAA